MLAVRRQAARFGWSELVTVVDDVDDAVAFVLAHDPTATATDADDGRRDAAAGAPTTPVTTAPLRLAASATELADDFARVARRSRRAPPRSRPTSTREADAVAARGPALPPGVPDADAPRRAGPRTGHHRPRRSRDLDQAFHAERQGHGFRVHYAIADVAAFVAPGGALDREAFARGETLYLPDGRAPLYPDVLGEGAASLLPDVDRPALLWTFELDAGGAARSRPAVSAPRCAAAPRSSYAEVQASIDRGDASPSLALLREIGEHCSIANVSAEA